jgi:ribosome biogenesis GTPase
LGSLEARILKVHSAFCEAALGAETVTCSFRGRLRKDSADVRAGDLVVLEEKGGGFVIERVLPRKNAMVRPPVANVDQVFVVTAVTQPPLDLTYLDRLLVHLESSEIDGAVCVNKADVEDPEEVSRLLDIYRKAGYTAVSTSAVTGHGLMELKNAMQGKTVVLAGASGVGKSKILSALIGTDLETGTLSRASRGRHTTKGVTLYRIGESGFLADTPGFSRLDVIDCEPSKLGYYYREMVELVPLCYYPRCLHKTEDPCEVRKAVEEGRISEERYRTYLNLLEESQDKERRKYE